MGTSRLVLESHNFANSCAWENQLLCFNTNFTKYLMPGKSKLAKEQPEVQQANE